MKRFLNLLFVIFKSFVFNPCLKTRITNVRLEKFKLNFSRCANRDVAPLSSLVLHLQHSFLLGHVINFSLQPQTLVVLDMAVNTSASKEAITKQRVRVLLITSWRMMERPVEVLDSFVFIE